MSDRKSNKLSPLGVLVMGALAVMAQSNVARAEDAASAQKLEKIEVTGSSIKRTVDDETALPVQIITRKDIEHSGAQSTDDLLRQITATSTAGGTQTSSGSGATTSGVSTVSLRGLGASRTLVLINGRRSTVFGGVPGSNAGDNAVDVNSIPVAAIERIEVLKDGASAIYGSDAIAGVVNFVLRKDFTGGEVSATYGDTLNNGGGTRKFNGLVGFGDLLNDHYNVLVGINAQRDGALYGKDRSFANTAILTDSTGASNSSASSNTFPANVYGPSGSRRSPAVATGCAPSSVVAGAGCLFDPGPYVALLPGSEKVNIFTTMSKVINDDMTAYGELAYGRNKVSYTIQPSPISYVFTVPLSNPYTAYLANYISTHPGLAQAYGANLAAYQSTPYSTPLSLFIPFGSPYYNQAISALSASDQAALTSNQSPVAVKFRSFINGLRSLQDVAESRRAVGGLKGTVLGWDYDASAVYAESKVTETPLSGYFSQSGFGQIFNTGVINPFGPSSPDVVAQVQALNVQGDAFQSKTSLSELGVKATREVYSLDAGAVSAALGASLRKDKFQFNSSTQIQSGDVSGYGGNFLPVSKSRNVEAAFGELEVPITKTITSDVAVRYENYEGVGNTTTPKVSMRWQPEKNLLVRSSYGKGFRAPSLTDLYASPTQGVSSILGNGDPLRCPINPNLPECSGSYQATTLNGGNAKLQPEKSENFTLGVVWEPTKDSSVSVDYYKVRLTNTITIAGLGATTVLSSAAYAQKYSQFIVRGAPDGNGAYGPIQYVDQTNQNLFNTLTDGVDVDLHWRFANNDSGRWTAGLNGTYVHKYDIQQPDGSYIGAVDNNYNSYSLNGTNLVSRWRYTATLNWEKPSTGWAATVAYNYQHGYTDAQALAGANTDANGNPVLPQVSAYHTMDLQASYSGLPNWVFTAGARNVFNDFPPYSNIGGQSSFQSGYDPSYGDPRGRFMYGTVTYKWK